MVLNHLVGHLVKEKNEYHNDHKELILMHLSAVRSPPHNLTIRTFQLDLHVLEPQPQFTEDRVNLIIKLFTPLDQQSKVIGCTRYSAYYDF